MTMPKARIDRWDADLSEEQRWELYDMSRSQAWYKMVEHVKQTYGIYPSRTSWYAWLTWMREAEAAHRLEQAIKARSELKDLAKTADIDNQTADAYIALASEAALRSDAKSATALVSAAMQIAKKMQNDQALKLREEALALERERFQAQEARLNAAQSTVSDSALSPDQQLAKVKAIFGLA